MKHIAWWSLVVCAAPAHQEDMDKLIRKLASETIEERNAAEQKLKAAPLTAIPLIEKGLASTDPEIASRCRRILPVLRERRALERLEAVLPGGAGHLTGAKPSEWMQALVEASSRLPDGRPRYPGLTREDLEPLATRARTDPQAAMRRDFLRIIGEWRLRDQASWVADLLTHESSHVRMTAATTLGALGFREAAPALAKLLKERRDEHGNDLSEVRLFAARALGDVGAAECVPDLVPLLRDEDYRVRECTAEVLADLGSTGAASELRRLLDDSYPGVRAAAVEALARLGALGKGEIRRFLTDPNFELAWRAAEALIIAGPGESVPALCDLMADPDGRHRETAARILFEIRPPGEPPAALTDLARDPKAPGRARALWALAAMGDRRVVPHMLDVLDTAKTFDRCIALAALGEVGAKEYLPAILRCFKDAEPSVRLGAVHAVGKLVAKEAIPELEALLTDRKVAGDAAAVLALLGSRAGVPKLLEGEDAVEMLAFNLDPLNLLRKPELVEKLRKTVLERDIAGRFDDVRAHLEKATGLVLDCSQVRMHRSDHRRVIRLHRGMNCWDALQKVMGYSLILEDGRARRLPSAAALEFWKSWWAEEQRKANSPGE